MRPSKAWLVVLLSGCQTQAVVEEEKPPTPKTDAANVVDHPTRVGQVFEQHELPPPSEWRISPSGLRVVAPLEDGCGVWSFDSRDFSSIATDPEDAAACERWPGLIPIPGTTPPTPLPRTALDDGQTIRRLWWEPRERWFVVEYSGDGTEEGGFVVTRDGQLGGLQWWRRAMPKSERVSVGWHDGPSPTWFELSLVVGWAGYALQISPARAQPIDFFELFNDAFNKPEPLELLGPSGGGRPIMRMKTCMLQDSGKLECESTDPIAPGCDPIGGWTSYWILACERAGSLRFVTTQPSATVPHETRALPGSDREQVEWVAAEARLAWWSKQSGLAVYEAYGELVAELPEVIGLTRATLDSELGLALVRTQAGLSILDLTSAKLGPSLATDITPITAAAFAPDNHALALSDGQRVHIWRFSSDDTLSWAAAGITKLAWRQDAKLLFGASLGTNPEQAWDPVTGEAVEPLAPELRARIDDETAQLDPTWRWAILAGQPEAFVEVVRLVDGLTLYAGQGGAITPSGLYQSGSEEWFLSTWRVGFGASPLADDWRTEQLTDHPANARADLVEVFFAGQAIAQPSW